MDGAFDRTAALVGNADFAALTKSTVLVVGLGGVGGAAFEALVRSGIGAFTVADGDVFEPSNLNRQILCTADVIGRNKAQVAAERALSINPDVRVNAVGEYVTAKNVDRLLCGADHCVDAIDDIPNKVALISACSRLGVPVVSAMGAGNRTDCAFAFCDIFQTKNDPFARKVRRALRENGIQKLDVVCAVDPPSVRSRMPLSVAPPPFVMGAMLASRVIERLTAHD